ncbi:hypothetical protein HNV11_15955 [Spirosoma taeanense]|uniref:Uncharacterized protein n=1 Tax=Spirosoma taeanense TaxID=2735870 RepID=A0A6M5Y932_9BACT|nr:hypothetical protein [Spirosoma taeanense]QJW90767.1 hypothetical protein HNV11_15955 [Spirosoma taeanense]
MEFIDNTVAWIKGELFEATLVLLFGIATVIAGLLFWKMGSTPGAKALLLPLVITGLVYIGVGGSMLVSNNKRMTQLPAAYQTGKRAFMEAEKKRVEDFQYQYRISKIVATLCFALTVGLFWLTKSPTWQGAGIGLALFGLAGLAVDYFSEQRAAIYYASILRSLQ